MNWVFKKFDQLTLQELYAILELRSKVFVVEQNCAYQDPDGKDQSAWHLMGMENDVLIAYTRILPPGVSYPEPAIGRVVTSPAHRGSGLGRELMKRSIAHCEKIFGNTPITLGAQRYLENFYQSLGFFPSSNEYIEDGIPHIEMTRKAST
ncbi:MAG TPA: GNAT family N-acetyltransferase [Chitinophagaceae bacterium]|nr:GNAT family N-acetyltransferase [Chitinophagaceae bacterium]